MLRLSCWLWLFLVFATPAFAQSKPEGDPVLNQAKQSAVLSLNQNFTVTRGIYIGDLSPCSLDAAFSNDPNGSSTVIPNLQPGAAYPFSLKRINSAGTTCSVVIGLW